MYSTHIRSHVGIAKDSLRNPFRILKESLRNPFRILPPQGIPKESSGLPRESSMNLKGSLRNP